MGTRGRALPELAPGYSTAEYWIAGSVTAVLFLAGLLAHELSHSLVAIRRGIHVRDITLWLLGGIATIEDEPESPQDELAIVLAGPAASIAVGVVALLVAAVADGLGDAPLFVATVAWLGSINLVLAVFNLAPAAPLDGGRVLRAWLWRRHGDRVRAARTAARAGETFAHVLIALGILELFFGAGVSGVWAILLGWFLLGAARAEKAQLEMEAQLAGLRVKDVMTPDPVTAPASITVDELLDSYVLRYRCTSFPLVADDGQHRRPGDARTLPGRDAPPACRNSCERGRMAIGRHHDRAARRAADPGVAPHVGWRRQDLGLRRQLGSSASCRPPMSHAPVRWRQSEASPGSRRALRCPTTRHTPSPDAQAMTARA